MTVNLSALAGAGEQFLDANGNPLTGGKLYSYEAGTTTPQVTFTTAAGNVPHANPIILDSAGRVPGGQIWLSIGLNYKFVLTSSTDTSIGAWDNITGINGTGINTNASLIAYDPAGLAAVQTTVQAKLRETVSVKDFGAVGDGVTDDTAAIQAALNYTVTNNIELTFPSGTYLTSAELTTSGSARINGCGSVIKASVLMDSVFTHSVTAFLFIRDLTIEGNALATNCFKSIGGIQQGSNITNVRLQNAIFANWNCQSFIYNMHVDQMIMSAGQYGLYVNNAGTLTNGARFTNLRVSNTTVWAVYLANNAASRASIAFANPTLEGNNGGGFYFKNHNALLEMPYFESNGRVSGDPDISIDTVSNVVSTVNLNMPIWGPGSAAQVKTINASTGPVRVTFENSHCQFSQFLGSSNAFIINGNNATLASRMFFYQLGIPTIENYSAGNILQTSFV